MVGIECKAEWYDNIYLNKTNPQYEGMYKNNLDYIFWKDILLMLNPKDNILDIGCGVGQFAQLLILNGITNYTGIDFSEIAILKAKRLNVENSYKFKQSNIFDFDFARYDTYIMLEVLEHIKHDVEVIQKIPKGRDIIISVPNFDSESHVRFFANIQEVKSRYGFYIDIKGIKEYSINDKSIFVLKGVRK